MNFTKQDITMVHPEAICRCFRHLENLIKKQEDILETVIKKTNSIENVVYQIIGGLYNQTTQANSIREHLNVLFKIRLQDKESREASDDEDSDKESTDEEEEKQVDTSKWETWPTTRQGDENEAQIEMKAEIATLKQAVLAKPTLCRSSVAHAEPINLDDLVEKGDEEEQDSQLLLRKIANTNFNSKKQFSRDFCGNE